MFSKILIANRGEIACRVMATAGRLGIKTVAVYSDADAGAQHVAMADQSVRIGTAAVAESYLQGDRIIDAALKTGAQAIHPGYGFLSENPEFVEAVEAAGLIFIGPPAKAIRAMGLKDAAKALMADAGVPVVPGYHGDEQGVDALAAQADTIGYPVLIKARAGGGGKGMRLVERPEDFAEALAGARREGQASFGDPVCLIEKFVTQPRHIEIQVFADAHGNVVHLFERDCSLQRRHQKVIEEAPAPDMPGNVRAAMGKAAVEAARTIGYRGAGTIEFIADGSGPLREDGFWFMEMNTRLQVEHPVSEAITGLDFVELQLRVAAGEALPFAQQDLSINGWSFEARVYAEDVPKGFLPAIGTLDHLSFPENRAFAVAPVRVDSGVREGDEITPWYDPMIAKVIVHGPTRAAALNQLTHALSACRVAGSVTNLEFLVALSKHKGFAHGEVDTGLIGRDLDALIEDREPTETVVALAAIAGLGLLREAEGNDPWDQLKGWRHWTDANQYVVLARGDAVLERQVRSLGHGRYAVLGAETGPVELGISASDGDDVVVEQDGVNHQVGVVARDDAVSIFLDGRSYVFQLPNALSSADATEAGGDAIIAPMPGLVSRMSASAGDTVSKGETLIVLEAMKMEHSLLAPRDGQVEEILTVEGAQVEDGAVLLRLEPEHG